VKRNLHLALAAALIAAGAVHDASAQMGRPSPGGADPSQRGGRGGPQGEPRTTGERPSMNQVEVAIEELREDLKLAPQQVPAWERYVDKVRAIADDATRERQRVQRAQDLTGMQRIDAAVDVARNRYTALEDAADAAKALYKSLSPEQQKIGDQRLASVLVLASQSGAGMAMPIGGLPRERPARGPQ
jgi:LTXXQ motif family protein